MQWTPILEPSHPLHGRASCALDAITRRILADDPRAVSPCRNLGAALLLTCQGIDSGVERLNAAIRSAEVLHSTRQLGLFDGLAGLGWVVEHLFRRLRGPSKDRIESPLNADVDAALLQELRRGRWQGAWDLGSGLSGFGIYFLERLPGADARQGLELVAGHLEEVARRRGFLVDPEVDLGFAHGVCGLAYFLVELESAGLALEPARKVLDQAIQRLMATSRLEGRLDAVAICLHSRREDCRAFAATQVEQCLTRAANGSDPSAGDAILWHWISQHGDSRCRAASLTCVERLLEMVDSPTMGSKNLEGKILGGELAAGLELLVAVSGAGQPY
jgi:Lanthionine synthetase C-like protein